VRSGAERFLTAALLALTALSTATALGQGVPPATNASSSAPTAQVAVKRPKIGLVLSGGGARGLTHVGVLKVLQELRVPVDYITATSMGSIVGGLHASGMPASTIEELVVLDPPLFPISRRGES
jgi:NTE family protein